MLLGKVPECLVPKLQNAKKEVLFAKLVPTDVLVDYSDDGSGSRAATEDKVPRVEDVEEEEEADIR